MRAWRVRLYPTGSSRAGDRYWGEITGRTATAGTILLVEEYAALRLVLRQLLRAEGYQVFESAPDAYLLLAPDPPHFTMVAANDARLRATMTRREDVIGRPLCEVFPDNPSDPTATGVRNLQASLAEVLRTGKPHRMALQQYDIRTPEGAFEERYWDPLNSPVFDDRGKLIYIIHRVEDVTEQVLAGRRLKALESVAEETTRRLTRETEARESVEAILSRLRESEQRYRLLADLIPQYIWTTDAKGYHGYFSRRWYEFTGATLDETKGTGWIQYLHPDDVERTSARWEHSLRTGERYSIEYRFRNTSGQYCWFWGQAVPQRNEAGEIVGWFGTLTDISERKRLDEEREQLLAREREARAEAERRREEVERVTESRTRLMRGFTHDVKNPLGAADGYAQLLEDGILGALSAKQVKSVQRIRRSIQTSLHLIHELLELARAEAGQLELEPVSTDVAELVPSAEPTAPGLGAATGSRSAWRTPGPGSRPGSGSSSSRSSPVSIRQRSTAREPGWRSAAASRDCSAATSPSRVAPAAAPRSRSGSRSLPRASGRDESELPPTP